MMVILLMVNMKEMESIILKMKSITLVNFWKEKDMEMENYFTRIKILNMKENLRTIILMVKGNINIKMVNLMMDNG